MRAIIINLKIAYNYQKFVSFHYKIFITMHPYFTQNLCVEKFILNKDNMNLQLLKSNSSHLLRINLS